MREIIFYESDFGDKPVEEFLIGLEASARAKVVRSLEMLRTLRVVPAKFWHKHLAIKNFGKFAPSTPATFIESSRPPRRATA
jgi:hypothetical protein